VPDKAGDRLYCVIVDLSKPVGRTVTYTGSESNAQFGQGTN
jgi:hypothetical protein